MKLNLKVIATLSFLFSINSYSASFAEITGAYLPDENGCKQTKIFGKVYDDSELNSVCIPMSTFLDENKSDLIMLAVTELKKPENLENVMRYELSKRQPIESYKVEIDERSSDIFKLVDGSVLEKTGSGYIGYVGYHEEAILFKDASQWKLCVNGSIVKVDILKMVQHHYSKDSLSLSIKDIEKHEICD